MKRTDAVSTAAALATVLALVAPSAVRAATDWNAPPVVTRVCSGCHGIDGNGPWPLVPRIAGQDADYLTRQLAAYAAAPRPASIEHPRWFAKPAAVLAGTRGGYDARTFMTGPAHDLAEGDRDAVVQWYAKQVPAPGRPADPTLAAQGRHIFETGVPDRGVPACSACHGPDGRGTGPFPRIAGQHAAYVVVQLAGFKSGERPLGTEMQAVTKSLTAPEMQAVAAYLQSM